MNVFIGFIFDEKEEMDLDKFIIEVGNVALQGIDALGDFKFTKIGKKAGFVVNEVQEVVPGEPAVA